MVRPKKVAGPMARSAAFEATHEGRVATKAEGRGCGATAIGLATATATSRVGFGLMLGLALLVGGCARGCSSPRPPIHLNPNMDLQPKYKAQAESAFFYDGATMRTPVDGTVARGELREDRALVEGMDDAGNFVANPLPIDEAILSRGKERYGIYCVPCHGENGNGKGVLWERAQIESGDLRQERLVDAPDGQIFDTITNGLGLMSGYKYPIPPHDRWAIVAYVRQLQQDG